MTKSFKEFKEYGKITFPNMSVGVNSLIFNVYFFRSGYSHENDGLAVKLVTFFGEPMNIRTPFSNTNF